MVAAAPTVARRPVAEAPFWFFLRLLQPTARLATDATDWAALLGWMSPRCRPGAQTKAPIKRHSSEPWNRFCSGPLTGRARSVYCPAELPMRPTDAPDARRHCGVVPVRGDMANPGVVVRALPFGVTVADRSAASGPTPRRGGAPKPWDQLTLLVLSGCPRRGKSDVTLLQVRRLETAVDTGKSSVRTHELTVAN